MDEPVSARWVLIKSGTSELDAVPYLNPWSKEQSHYPTFSDFEVAKEALRQLLMDQLDILKECYDEKLSLYKRQNPLLSQYGLAYYYSEDGQYLSQKIIRFMDYVEISKEAKNYEELDFKFHVLWSNLNKHLSVHYEILGKMKCPSVEDENRLEDVYLIRASNNRYMAILRKATGPKILSSEELNDRLYQVKIISKELNTLLQLCQQRSLT